MAILEYNEIKEKKIIIHNDEPCEVLESHVARTQQRKPQNQVKLKSLISGRTYNESFHTSDSAEEADIEKKEVKFLYSGKGEYWFCDPEEPKNRFKIEANLMGDGTKFLKDNMIVTSLVWDNDGTDQVIAIKLPVKIDFLIKDAPPSIKGNTANGGNKVLTLENGTNVNGPLFLEIGERIIVNTETGEYVERA